MSGLFGEVGEDKKIMVAVSAMAVLAAVLEFSPADTVFEAVSVGLLVVFTNMAGTAYADLAIDASAWLSRLREKAPTWEYANAAEWSLVIPTATATAAGMLGHLSALQTAVAFNAALAVVAANVGWIVIFLALSITKHARGCIGGSAA